MDVGTLTIAFISIAFFVSALMQMVLKRWLVSVASGIVASHIPFLVIFGPSKPSEILLPLLFSAFWALLGAAAVAGVRRLRGTL